MACGRNFKTYHIFALGETRCPRCGWVNGESSPEEKVKMARMEALNAYIDEIERRNKNNDDVKYTEGRKFYRVTVAGSAHTFVEMATGNVYRADTWSKRGRLIGNTSEPEGLFHNLDQDGNVKLKGWWSRYNR